MKKKNKVIVILILLTLEGICFSQDVSSDSSDDKTLSKEKSLSGNKANNPFILMKFRGGVSLGYAYYFQNDPLKISDHINPVNYNVNDFTDDGDPDYRYHTKGYPGIKLIPGLNSKVTLNAYYKAMVPFLAGDNFLVKDNKISLGFTGEITPVSLKGGLYLTFTPIAFLNFSAGTTIGSGWNFAGLNGMARYNPGRVYPGEKKKVLDEDSFKYAVMENWLTGTLQFDISAVIPEKYKRWTHIIAAASVSFKHISMLGNEFYDRPFIWQLDIKQTGWTWSVDFLIGYKIPVIVDERKESGDEKQFLNYVRHNNFAITLSMYVSPGGNMTHYNDSIMASDGWGSDFILCQFGPMILFDLPNNFNILLGLQWSKGKTYTDNTIGNLNIYDKEYKDWNVFLDRFVFTFGWSF